MHLKLLDQDKFPFAKCMDGTAPGYYYTAGTVDKAVITLGGGAYCLGYEDNIEDFYSCTKRKLTDYGSSKFLSSTHSSAVLDSHFFDGWHKYSVNYCSSDNWAGTATEADE